MLITTVKSNGYFIPVIAASENPTDNAVVYFGLGPRPITTANITRIYIPQSGIITAASIGFSTQGTAMSSHAMTLNIRLNNTTDTAIATVTDTNAWKHFTNNSLSISVVGGVAGDYIEFKITYPAFTTNPTAIHWTGWIWVSC